jgi:DnaJ-domain-containing protein 1
MTDNFALLDEPRRPWIDPGELKHKFLALSAEIHPDRTHAAPEGERRAAAERYLALNTAYNCLRDPKERLRHLLELELGAKPADIQRIPTEMMDAFFEIGRVSKEADGFLAEKARVSSPLLKVQWFERAQEWTEKLTTLQRNINVRRKNLLSELQGMNAAWEAVPREQRSSTGLPLKRLEEIYRLLSYFGRWSEQLQERIVQLSF